MRLPSKIRVGITFPHCGGVFRLSRKCIHLDGEVLAAAQDGGCSTQGCNQHCNLYCPVFFCTSYVCPSFAVWRILIYFYPKIRQILFIHLVISESTSKCVPPSPLQTIKMGSFQASTGDGWTLANTRMTDVVSDVVLQSSAYSSWPIVEDINFHNLKRN
jgi:hypothetical protein